MVIIDETIINGFRLTLCEDQDAAFCVHEANLHDDDDYDFREFATLDEAVVYFVERQAGAPQQPQRRVAGRQ